MYKVSYCFVGRRRCQQMFLLVADAFYCTTINSELEQETGRERGRKEKREGGRGGRGGRGGGEEGEEEEGGGGGGGRRGGGGGRRRREEEEGGGGSEEWKEEEEVRSGTEGVSNEEAGECAISSC